MANNTSDNEQIDSTEETTQDLSRIVDAIWERWWLIPIALGVTLGLALLYLKIATVKYTSTTTIQVEQSQTAILGTTAAAVTQDDLKEDDMLKTVEQNLVSEEVLEGLITNLGLTPKDLGDRNDTNLETAELAEILSKQVKAKLERGTRLITITVKNHNPLLAQKMAAAVVTQYVNSEKDRKMSVADQTDDYLTVEITNALGRLEAAEARAQAYKDAHPEVDLDDSTNYIDSRMLSLNERINDAKKIRIALESDNLLARKILEETNTVTKVDQLLGIQSIAADQNVIQLQKAVSDEAATFEAVRKTCLPDHPQYQQEQSKYNQIKTSLNQAILTAAQGLGTAVDSAKKTEESFQQILSDEQRQRTANYKLTIPYEALTRDIQQSQDFLNTLRERERETEATAAADENKIEVIDPPDLPYKPSSPNIPLILAGGILLGLIMGVGTAVGWSFFDSSFKGIEEAEFKLDLPAVGAIPIDKKGREERAIDFTILKEPNSAIAESYRTLRAAVQMLTDKVSKPVYLFTSGIPGEGKSFTSANFAIAMAQLGRRTLLIDADLRLPVQEGIFFGSKRHPEGFATVLSGATPIEKSAFETGIANLYLMPSGRRPPNPAELIANADFPKILAQMQEQFDTIIIDSAPVHAVSDTLLIGKHVTAAFLVVYASSTPANAVLRAVKKMQMGKAPLLGFVLNQLPTNKSIYYYQYSDSSYGTGTYDVDLEQTEDSEKNKPAT